MDVQAILKKMPTLLPQSRWAHSQRVAEEAGQLAQAHGLNPTYSQISGYVHDIAKPMTPEDLGRLGIPVKDRLVDVYDQFPQVWHAFVGPVVTRHYFDVSQSEVLDPIKWHTTGSSQMGPYGQVLYLADYYEPGRNLPVSDYVKQSAYANLDQAAFAVAWLSIQWLANQGKKIHPNTVDCYDWFADRLGEKAESIIQDLRVICDKAGNR